MSNPTLSTDALKAERLAAFINLAKVSPLAIANVLAAVIDDCEKEMGKVATLEQKVSLLTDALEMEVNETAALTRRNQRLEVALDDVHAKRGALLRELQNRSCENAALKQELDARTAEFEEKYYGLDLLNRALEKCNTFHVERTAELTKRLAQAEAALGVPAYDEWDVWSDAANRNA